MKASSDGLKITVDLPGFESDDVKVEIRDGQLMISGERRTTTVQGQSQTRFQRTVELPEGVDAQAADAVLSEGVLQITLAATAMS